jgi:hypothetical protein
LGRTLTFRPVLTEAFTSRMQKLAYGSGYNDYEFFSPDHCNLVLRGDQLIAVANQDGNYYANVRRHDQDVVALINNQSVYFVPEHADSSLLRKRGEELWFEATIPRKGPPRPIRL